MKIDLKDTTFIIPIRIDTIMRLENLMLSIEYITQFFDTNILVLEAAPYNNCFIQKIIGENITYQFIEDKDPVYYKTKYLNLMAQKVNTDIIGIWDVDVLADYKQIVDSIQQLREKNYDIAYPFDRHCYDTSDIFRNHYMIHRDIEFLKEHRSKMILLYNVEGVIGAVGGAIFALTNEYIESGMDNETFYGWGLEDGERHYRWLIMDYKIYRSQGPLFHLTHPRDLNGMFRSIEHQEKAEHDINDVMNYTKDEVNKINTYK